MNENVSNISTFDEWMPNIYYVDISEYSAVTEDAIANNKYGVYISTGEGIHAYHGKSPIDYRLCKHLGVRVVELNYDGGIIIGSANDLSIIIVFPASLNMTHSIMINKIRDIIGKYIPDTTIDRNDILVNGEKVSGSMTRQVGDCFVWAAQISFADYSDYIHLICSKPSIKKPAYIDSNLLTRDNLEAEILAWLQKQS